MDDEATGKQITIPCMALENLDYDDDQGKSDLFFEQIQRFLVIFLIHVCL